MSLIQGKLAEKQAAEFLKKEGLQLVTSGFRSHFGEIDLIMEDNEILVFIEVKFRKKIDQGRGSESIDLRKQKRLIKTALSYLQKENLFEKKICRFDVVDIFENQIDWIKDAFQWTE